MFLLIARDHLATAHCAIVAYTLYIVKVLSIASNYTLFQHMCVFMENAFLSVECDRSLKKREKSLGKG